MKENNNKEKVYNYEAQVRFALPPNMTLEQLQNFKVASFKIGDHEFKVNDSTLNMPLMLAEDIVRNYENNK